MRRTAFCICKNKDVDQLCEADQGLCFPSTDGTISLPKSEILCHYLSSVVVQPGLCRTWSETPKTGFLTTRLIYAFVVSCLDRMVSLDSYRNLKPQVGFSC